MGIYDRDYMRRRPDGSPAFPLKWLVGAAVGLLVLVYAVTQWQKTSSMRVKQTRVSSTPAAPSAPATTPKPGKGTLRVNVNNATAAELETLMGVGPAKAKMIIDRRPYSSPDDLVIRCYGRKAVREPTTVAENRRRDRTPTFGMTITAPKDEAGNGLASR